jgi:hypothetical protein
MSTHSFTKKKKVISTKLVGWLVNDSFRQGSYEAEGEGKRPVGPGIYLSIYLSICNAPFTLPSVAMSS